jgi:hypothetical protein
MRHRLQPFYTRRTSLLVASFAHELCPEDQAELACIECLISANGAAWYAQARRRLLAMLEQDGSDA